MRIQIIILTLLAHRCLQDATEILINPLPSPVPEAGIPPTPAEDAEDDVKYENCPDFEELCSREISACVELQGCLTPYMALSSLGTNTTTALGCASMDILAQEPDKTYRDCLMTAFNVRRGSEEFAGFSAILNCLRCCGCATPTPTAVPSIPPVVVPDDFATGELTDGDSVTVGTGVLGETYNYLIRLEKGESLLVTSHGGVGDMDIFLCPNTIERLPSDPTQLWFYCKLSTNVGTNDELVGYEGTYSGKYYIYLTSIGDPDEQHHPTFSGVTVDVKIFPDQPFSCLMVIDRDYSKIANFTQYEGVFVKDVCYALSAINQFECPRINVLQMRDGSVEVYFDINSASDDDPGGIWRITAVLTLQDQFHADVSRLKDGSVTNDASEFAFNVEVPPPVTEIADGEDHDAEDITETAEIADGEDPEEEDIPGKPASDLVAWMIGVIVAAGVIFIILVVLIIYCCCCRGGKKTKKDTQDIPKKGYEEPARTVPAIVPGIGIELAEPSKSSSEEEPNVDESKVDELKADEHVAGELTAGEEPTAEEPTAEEPTAEEPTAEGPTAEVSGS